MNHLHHAMGIRLHAIGISTAELFHRRGKWDPHPASIPDHALLEELVKVGGGDPITVGGPDVLSQYFSELGSDVVHRVTDRLTSLPAASGTLAEPTLAALRKLSAPGHDLDARRQELKSLLADAVGSWGEQLVRVVGHPLWKPMAWSRVLTDRCGTTVANSGQLAQFLTDIARAFAVDEAALGVAELRS